jgi:uncharacterized protein with PIN domain
MLNERRNGLLILDAYPLVAVLRGEQVGIAVAEMLAQARGDAAVSAITAAEVVDFVARSQHVQANEVAATVDLWIEGGLTVIPVEWAIGTRAAELRALHYHRSRMPVSLAGCVALALAEQLDATLVTSDPPLLRVARKVGATIQSVGGNTGGWRASAV